MLYGVCGGPEIAEQAKTAGYDFFEWSVGGLLNPRAGDDVFAQALAAVRAAALPCPVLNCFVPADLKITGPSASLRALEDFVTVAFRRAQMAKVDTIVFGSGGARQVPDGFDHRQARQQIIAFCRMAAPLAQDRDLTLVVEPLNTAECNILNTVAECAEIVRAAYHPALRLLVDAYHWARDNDSADDIARNASSLKHVHIATTANRRPPGVEPCEFSRFFGGLRRAGYNGRISIEANIRNSASELPVALALMKSEA